MLIYVNGNYVKDTEAVISPYDHGYLYGVGVFETLRVYAGHCFLFDDHFERLQFSLSTLSIQWNMEKETILNILHELLRRNDLQDAYIRLNVSAGIGEVGLQTEPYTSPSVIIFVKPLPVSNTITKKTGVILQLSRNTPEGYLRLKSHHYLNSILGKREVGDDPMKEGLFLTKEGYVAEGVVSNIFFVKCGVLYTPAVETGILNGITRNFIIEIAKSIHMQVIEGFFTKEELFESDEVFVTNSIQEIVPMHTIDTVSFTNNPITLELIRVYRKFRNVLRSKHELIKGDAK
ncbi:aminodeoxychorismate lyase [Ectobacillus sp. sgz5001026]|uniref:aminodeoxychorismate lyase n=1 Tax=Ectobacillus sp. sgz5001026 TaxID=3242473 RepID=UPI0036D2D4E5